MSFGYASPRQTTSKLLDSVPAFVRPSEWIALTPVGASEQKFSGLYAVYPNNEENYVALTANTTSGTNYTIDWGDGTVENILSGTQANHQYNYASVGNLTSYGYKQVIITITPQTTNLTVINLRNRPNYSGAVSTTSTWISKWLDIEVGSPNLTSLVVGANNGTISLPLLQRVRWVSKSTSYVSQQDFFYWCTALRSVIFDCDMSNWNTMSAMFYFCQNLVYAPYFNTSSVTTMANAFSNCYNLVSVPFYKTTSALTSMNSAFSNCYRLKYVGGFANTDFVTDLTNAFNTCRELVSIPPLNLPRALNLNSTFVNCSALTSIKISNITNCTSFNSSFAASTALTNVTIGGSLSGANIQMIGTFNGCNNLSYLSLPNTANVSNLQQTFTSCSSLITMPITYAPNVTSLNGTYQFCYGLTSVANMNTSKCTDFTSTFSGITSITDAPNFDTSKATAVTNMYQSCLNLRSLPAYNLANVTSGQGLILANPGAGVGVSSPILTSNVTGIKYTISYAQCQMNAASLTTVMTNLGSVGAAAQTLTITGNPGADTALSKTATWTNSSNTMTMANTVGVTTGTQISNTANVNLGFAATLTSNKVSVASFIDSNTIIAFSSVTTSNATANTLYYTSNRAGAGPYTYDISTTQGGTPITFTNGTANMNINIQVTGVVTNTSVTLNAYPAGSGSNTTLTTRVLNTNLATYKGWTVTG